MAYFLIDCHHALNKDLGKASEVNITLTVLHTEFDGVDSEGLAGLSYDLV